MMVNKWLELITNLSYNPQKNTFYCGCRKIYRDVRWSTDVTVFSGGRMEQFGYTKSKMTMLNRLYFHEESVATASRLWDVRKAKKKYGSVSFTTYSHLVKGNENAGSKRRSIMGPCIQAGVITYIPHDKSAELDLFYRTTEVFKKFPADLVWLQDCVLPRFNFDGAPLKTVRFHFANLTLHPMYAVVAYPHMVNPIRYLEEIRRLDERQWIWQIKWTARYLCPEYANGIQKFSQALRVQVGAEALLDAKTKEKLRQYIYKHHPGQLLSDDEEEDED